MTREDPLRIVYPASVDYLCSRKIHDQELTRGTQISDGVFPTYHKGVRYILKIVTRYSYKSCDTRVFQKELENLGYFADVRGIVQTAEVAMSISPLCAREDSNGLLVVTQTLLRAYPKCSFPEVLSETGSNSTLRAS